MAEHAAGVGSIYTRSRCPVELVWCQEFGNVGEAYAFEKQIQGWGRAKREALIEGQFELLPGLARKKWPRK